MARSSQCAAAFAAGRPGDDPATAEAAHQVHLAGESRASNRTAVPAGYRQPVDPSRPRGRNSSAGFASAKW